MGETDKNIIGKDSILLSGNQPQALIVGAAGFLGSHLTDQLLKKNIGVIGVDDFSTGNKRNIASAIKDSNFHLLEISAGELEIDLNRLDYLLIVSSDGFDLAKIFALLKKHQPKVVFVSSIEAYQRGKLDNLSWFLKAEKEIAKFAHENKINARIVRLATVYGPRMHFRIEDSLYSLLLAALTGDLQQEAMISEFSTRALYIDDAVELLIKSLLKGATAMKIFDGALLTPIKLVEIKQILLDPLWYENKGFVPSELPPWPTPNLEKTMKELSWQPQAYLVKALERTISYLKENPSETPSHDTPRKLPKIEPDETPLIEEKKPDKIFLKIPKISFPIGKFLWLVTLAIFFVTLIMPLGFFVLDTILLGQKIENALDYLSTGEFDKSLSNIDKAQNNINQQRFIWSTLNLKSVNTLITLLDLITQATAHSVVGTQAIYDTIKAVNGETNTPSGEVLTKAKVELVAANEKLAKAQVILKDTDFRNSLPMVINSRLDKLATKVDFYLEIIKRVRFSADLLNFMIASDGSKSWLVLLQNNMELRPTGGFIGSFGQIDFENGKLKKIDVNDIYAIDGQLTSHVEPPTEIKQDLGQKDWFLRDSNWEADFPTSAREAEWFYTKETAKKVDGVIALDLSAIGELLKVLGPLNLTDYDEKITEQNLFAKSVAHAETNFSPGSQAKKNFLTSLTNQLFNKLFFLPGQNWLGIAVSLSKSLENKHLMIYLKDPKLFSAVISQNWGAVLPRQSDELPGEFADFIAPVEANLGANKANYYLERKYSLDTVISKDGGVSHNLKIDYTNRSPADVWPAGKYKNRMRLYLTYGAKIDNVLWGEEDITKQVSAFVDYGRTAYSFLLVLNPKESRTLKLSYSLPGNLKFKDNAVIYKLAIIKQAGTMADPLEWQLSYPLNYQISSANPSIVKPQQHVISTDLSTDRSFEIKFQK